MSKNYDQIHRFLFDNANIRGEVLSLRSSYLDACQYQDLPPTAKILLGEFLAAASLLGEVLKTDGTITLQARGDGLIPLIMAEIDNKGNLRGIAKVGQGLSEADILGLDIKKLIGRGVLSLTVDPLKGQRYQGIIEVSGASLAETLTQYFCQSEQLPTQVWLHATESFSGGLLLQALPDTVTQSHDSEQWTTATQLATTLTSEELLTLDHAQILTRLFSEEYNVRIFEPKDLRFSCHCSEERCHQTLQTLGEEDVLDLLKTNQSIDISCEFCGHNYRFTEDHIKLIFAQSSPKPPSSNTLH